MTLDGKPIAPRDTNEAISLGVSSVFQELTLVRELTVERNLLLTSAPTTLWGSIDRRKARRAAQEILTRHNLDIDPGRRRRRPLARAAADAGDRARDRA